MRIRVNSRGDGRLFHDLSRLLNLFQILHLNLLTGVLAVSQRLPGLFLLRISQLLLLLLVIFCHLGLLWLIVISLDLSKQQRIEQSIVRDAWSIDARVVVLQNRRVWEPLASVRLGLCRVELRLVSNHHVHGLGPQLCGVDIDIREALIAPPVGYVGFLADSLRLGQLYKENILLERGLLDERLSCVR